MQCIKTQRLESCLKLLYLAIDHIHHILYVVFACRSDKVTKILLCLDGDITLTVPTCPVVPGTATLCIYNEIFRIVQLFVVSGLNAVNHSVLQVKQNCARNIVLVVRLPTYVRSWRISHFEIWVPSLTN